MSRRRLASTALLLIVWTLVAPARAQGGPEVALAEALYQQGRALVAEGRYAEACPKFGESYRLDPATGTLLNLAACYEHTGKTASAWLAYNEAIAASRRDGRDDRVRYVQERLAALESRLSRLTIHVAPGADVAGLAIHLNGVLVGPAARGLATPVDPGPHRIEASAPGRTPWALDVVVADYGDSRVVIVPALLLAAPAPAPLRLGAPAVGPAEVRADQTAWTSRPVPSSVVVASATTLVFAATAIATSALYLEQKADYDRTEADYDSLRQLGWLNLGAWVGTAASAAVTSYLYVTRPARPELRAAVLPWLGERALGAEWRQRF